MGFIKFLPKCETPLTMTGVKQPLVPLATLDSQPEIWRAVSVAIQADPTNAANIKLGDTSVDTKFLNMPPGAVITIELDESGGDEDIIYVDLREIFANGTAPDKVNIMVLRETRASYSSGV